MRKLDRRADLMLRKLNKKLAGGLDMKKLFLNARMRTKTARAEDKEVVGEVGRLLKL